LRPRPDVGYLHEESPISGWSGSGDLDRIAADYSDNCIQVSNRQIRRGKAGVKEAFAQLFSDLSAAGEVKGLEVPVRVFEDNVLYIEWWADLGDMRCDGVDMVRRLVVEPVWIGLQLKPQGVLADIGSGNGSPAIPLHVVSKFRRAHLIEVRARRAAFLRHLTTTLTLTDVIIHRVRFEEVVSELEPVDWISLQGVAFSGRLIDSIRKVASATTTMS